MCLQILPLCRIAFDVGIFDLDSDMFQEMVRFYSRYKDPDADDDDDDVYDSAIIKTALATETGQDMFSNDRQQDASEALDFILNKLESIGDMTKVKINVSSTLI